MQNTSRPQQRQQIVHLSIGKHTSSPEQRQKIVYLRIGARLRDQSNNNKSLALLRDQSNGNKSYILAPATTLRDLSKAFGHHFETKATATNRSPHKSHIRSPVLRFTMCCRCFGLETMITICCCCFGLEVVPQCGDIQIVVAFALDSNWWCSNAMEYGLLSLI